MTDLLQQIEQRLKAAQERLAQAAAAMAPRHKGGEWEEYWAAHGEMLGLERELEAAKGEEYAEPLDFPAIWDTGTPLPHLFVNDCRALLVFRLSNPDPEWDGRSVATKNPRTAEDEPFALVEFERCLSTRFGTPNDEVLEGHPLHGKGLDAYTAQRVVNSRWLRELEKINSVHSMYQPDLWRGLHHYVFWFHDSSFECVARSYRVETFRSRLPDVLAEAMKRWIV